MYRQSLSLRLGEDTHAYEVVVEPDEVLAEDTATGWVYVVRSKSGDPAIASRPDLYKIGFSTTPVEKRIANAANVPTYLMAPVEVVSTYRTYNMNTAALEHLLHRVFAEVRLDISQTGADARRYDVTEWFEVPFEVIDKAVGLIVSGDIVEYVYDPRVRGLVGR